MIFQLILTFFIAVRIFSMRAGEGSHNDVDTFLLDDRNQRAPGLGPRKDSLDTIVDHPSTRILLLSLFRDFCERHIL